MESVSIHIIDKLNSFITKLYLKQLYKGLLILFSYFLIIGLGITLIEYSGHYGIKVRTFIYYFYLISNSIILSYFVIVPSLKLLRIIKPLSIKDATIHISNYYTDVKDQLINLLELINTKNEERFSDELIIAAINRKADNLKSYNFIKAINKKDIIIVARISVLVLITSVITIFFKPIAISKGAERIINYKEYYTPKNYFEIQLLNQILEVNRGDNYLVKAKVVGNFIPEEVTIEYFGNHFLMNNDSLNIYTYNFSSINNNLKFSLNSGNYKSATHELIVNNVPIILEHTIDLIFPKYLNQENKRLKNIGDIRVPVGTEIRWKYNTVYTDTIEMLFGNGDINKLSKANDFMCIKKIYKNQKYSISVKNEKVKKANILNYNIEVIPDLYPGIQIKYVQDSINMNIIHVYGRIEDDYGFSKLEIVANGKEEIPINKNINVQDFYFVYDIRNDDSVKKINIYLQVWDNDKVNGSKYSKSEEFNFIIPDSDELKEKKYKAIKDIKDKINKSLFVADELKWDLKEIKKNIINNEYSDWELQQQLENIIDKQKFLENTLEDLKKINKEKNSLLESFKEVDEEFLKKQKELSELMDNLMNDELRDLFKELEELLKNQEKIDFDELYKDLDFSYDELEKELDRNLELLKRYEIEEKVFDKIDELNKLAEEQKDLSNTDENELEKQNKIEEEIKKLEEEYKEILKDNEELSKPLSMDEFEKDFEDIKKEMSEGSENLSNNKGKKANQNQEKASDKMKNLSGKMSQMMESNKSEMAYENMDDLRQILDNLLMFSIEQEANLNYLESTNINDPGYNNVKRKQNELHDNFKIVEDSLNALGKRVEQISKIIDEEVYSINNQMLKVDENLNDRNKNESLLRQQYVMTGANNLALLLQEMLESMMNSMGEGSSGCDSKNKKKGKGKSGIQNLRKGQESIKNQLQDMINQMNKAGKGGKGLSKSMSEMLAKQEIYQKMLQDLINSSAVGSDLTKQLNEINQLIQQNKRDLINQKIDRNLLNRQEKIITRLLEAENSDFEREKEKRRKSKENLREYNSNINKLFEYKEENYNFNEILNINNLKLNEYYKKKYKNYLLKLTNE